MITRVSGRTARAGFSIAEPINDTSSFRRYSDHDRSPRAFTDSGVVSSVA